MSLSDAALLEETRLAIDALTTGGASQYSLNGQMVTKVDLPTLWKQVGTLEGRIGNGGRKGMFSGSRMRGAR